MVCAVVDLAAQTVTYSNAGHPPPLLVHGDEVVWLDQALAAPLAVDEPERTEARIDVRPDDLLVLYTDGLVERRNENLDEGLARLARVTVAHAPGNRYRASPYRCLAPSWWARPPPAMTWRSW